MINKHVEYQCNILMLQKIGFVIFVNFFILGWNMTEAYFWHSLRISSYRRQTWYWTMREYKQCWFILNMELPKLLSVKIWLMEMASLLNSLCTLQDSLKSGRQFKNGIKTEQEIILEKNIWRLYYSIYLMWACEGQAHCGVLRKCCKVLVMEGSRQTCGVF